MEEQEEKKKTPRKTTKKEGEVEKKTTTRKTTTKKTEPKEKETEKKVASTKKTTKKTTSTKATSEKPKTTTRTKKAVETAKKAEAVEEKPKPKKTTTTKTTAAKTTAKAATKKTSTASKTTTQKKATSTTRKKAEPKTEKKQIGIELEFKKEEKEARLQREQEKELAKKLTVPEDLKKKIRGQFAKNVFLAICVCAYYVLITLGYQNIAQDIFIVDLKVFAGALILTTIALFERAYKKDSGLLCLHGLEALYMAVVSLYMPYLFFYFREDFRPLLITILFVVPVTYYFIKALIVDYRLSKKHKETISDVKEIVTKKKEQVEE